MGHHHKQLSNYRWQSVRRTVFERDGWRCVRCGRRGRLECDHTIPLAVDPDQDRYNPAGCQTLCRDCHIRKTADENRRPVSPADAAWRTMIEELLPKN